MLIRILEEHSKHSLNKSPDIVRGEGVERLSEEGKGIK